MEPISGVVKPPMNQALYLSVDVVALAQPAEHRIVDPKVTGSTPVGHPTRSPWSGSELDDPDDPEDHQDDQDHADDSYATTSHLLVSHSVSHNGVIILARST